MVNLHESEDALVNLVIPDKLKHGTVLIAEDSKTAQRHLRQIFTQAKIAYQIFNNGKDLIDYINSHPNPSSIPAVITDIEMPEMSGFTVVRLLKANPLTKLIPVIVNSSMTGANNKREASGLGADGFIDKTKSQNIIPLIVSKMEDIRQLQLAQ
jgi:two-component system chemotaxis response regulator CheV